MALYAFIVLGWFGEGVSSGPAARRGFTPPLRLGATERREEVQELERRLAALVDQPRDSCAR
jgi:hypothetical protein